MLVGMDPGGALINISIVYHNEPFGYFSIDLPKFIEQFRGKSVLAPMTVGQDIDAVSRATITNSAAVRSIPGTVFNLNRTRCTRIEIVIGNEADPMEGVGTVQ